MTQALPADARPETKADDGVAVPCDGAEMVPDLHGRALLFRMDDTIVP